MARAAGIMLLAVLVLLTANVSAWSIPLGQSSRDGRIGSFESEKYLTAPEIEQLLDEITVGKNMEEDTGIATIITPISRENEELHLKILPSLKQRLFEGFPGSKNFQKSGSFEKSKLIKPRLYQQNAFDESDNQEISISMKPPQCSTAGLCRTTKQKCKTVTCSTKQPCEPTAAPVTPDLCGTTEAPEEENCGTTESPEKESCETTENPCEKTREPCQSKKSFCATKKAPKSVPRKFPGSNNLRKSGSFKKSKLIKPRLHHQHAESDNQEISISMKPPQCSTAGLCRTTEKKCKTVTCSTKQPCEPTAAPVTPDLCGTTEAPEEENCGTTESPEKEICETTEKPCEKTREPCESTKSFCATKKAPKSVPRKFPGSNNLRKSGSFKKSKLIKPRLHHQHAESGNQENSISMKPPQCSTAGLCRTTKKKCKTVTCSTEQPCEPTAALFTPDLCGTTEYPEEENCGTTEAPEKENCETTENPCEKTREPCQSKKSFCATKKAPKSVPRKFPGSKNFRKSGSFKKSKLIKPRLYQQNAFDESDNQEISISMKPPQCSTAGLCRTAKKKCKTVTCSTKQPCEPTVALFTPDLCGTTEAPEGGNCGATESPEKEICETTEKPCEKTREPCESTKSFCATKKVPKSVPRKFPGSNNLRKSGSFKKSKLFKPRLHHQHAESGNQENSISMKPPQCSTAGLCRTTKKKCKTVTCSTKQPCEPTAALFTPDLCGTTEYPEEENCGTTEAPEKENCETTENPCEKTREPCESKKSFCATKKAPKSVPRKFPGSINFRESGSFKKSKLIKPRLYQQNAFDESDNQEISISMKPPQCSTAGLCRTTKKKCKTVTCSTKQSCEPTAAPVTPDLCGTTEAPEEENCGTTESPEKERCETT